MRSGTGGRSNKRLPGASTFAPARRPCSAVQKAALTAGCTSAGWRFGRSRRQSHGTSQQAVVKWALRQLPGAVGGDQHLLLELDALAAADFADIALDAEDH